MAKCVLGLTEVADCTRSNGYGNSFYQTEREQIDRLGRRSKAIISDGVRSMKRDWKCSMLCVALLRQSAGRRIDLRNLVALATASV